MACQELSSLHKDLHAGRVQLWGRLSPAFFTKKTANKAKFFLPLFCRATDFIMEYVNRKLGITLGDNLITDLDHADGVVLLVERVA